MLKKILFFCVATLTTPYYSSASTPKAANNRLNKEQLEHYSREGYVIVRKLFSKTEVNNIESAANALKYKALRLAKKHRVQAELKLIDGGTQFVLDKNQKDYVVKRVVWAGKSKKKLFQYGRSPKILRPVSQILNADTANHLINQLHFKLPQDGVAFPWHMDLQNRMDFDENWKDVNGQGSYVVAITAIDKTTRENGPIYIIPGSHLLKDLDFPPFCKTKSLPKVLNAAKAAIPLLMESGDTVFMHPRLVHGSWENNSQKERKTFINGFSYPGANYAQYPGEGSGKLITLDAIK